MTEQRRRRRTVVLLAVVFGVLVAITGVFGTLYVVARGDTSRVNEQLAATEEKVSDADARLATTKSTVDDRERERAELTDANTKLHACADPAAASIAAVNAGDDAALGNAVDLMLDNCGR
jgi:hypothetical protein